MIDPSMAKIFILFSLKMAAMNFYDLSATNEENSDHARSSDDIKPGLVGFP